MYLCPCMRLPLAVHIYQISVDAFSPFLDARFAQPPCARAFFSTLSDRSDRYMCVIVCVQQEGPPVVFASKPVQFM